MLTAHLHHLICMAHACQIGEHVNDEQEPVMSIPILETIYIMPPALCDLPKDAAHP